MLEMVRQEMAALLDRRLRDTILRIGLRWMGGSTSFRRITVVRFRLVILCS